MHRRHTFTVLVLVAAALGLLAYVTSGGARLWSLDATTTPLPADFSYQDPVTVDIALSEPIVLNQPVTATVTVCVREDRPKMRVRLAAAGNLPIGLEHSQVNPLGDMRPGECRQQLFTFRLPHTGLYFLVAATADQFGGSYVESMDVKITESEVVINPTPAPRIGGVEEQQGVTPVLPTPTAPARP